jgi:indole-3-glycerol phosphate synthase
MAARHAPSATYLSGIVEAHRKSAASDTRDPESLLEEAVGSPETRGFRRALDRLGANGLTGVIAEIKRRSPSRGDLAPDLDPAGLAVEYERGGATCLSVLTDERFFGGSSSDLRAAKGACGLPVLRKDFTVSGADVADARIMGADAVLLIVAALSEPELTSLLAIARGLGLDSLVEVHDESELEVALGSGADLVGVNQRDLETFEVDHELAVRLAALIPDTVVAVAESGIRGPQDVSRLAACGFQGVLVGESVVTSADPSRAVKALSGHRIAPRQTAGS